MQKSYKAKIQAKNNTDKNVRIIVITKETIPHNPKNRPQEGQGITN